jgi:ubiquinone/menaquinone biosynthesis C-methylase UbiE
MTHEEHVNLIKKAITKKGGVWADFGSGDGAFTLALRDLAGADAQIYSIDKDKGRLQTQEREFERMFPNSKIQFVSTDFTKQLDLSPLDGIVMANSLHYVKEQQAFLKAIRKYLKPQGKLVLVEYFIDKGNYWVPYPLSYPSFAKVAKEAGYTKTELLERSPSTYWDEMYSAQALL